MLFVHQGGFVVLRRGLDVFRNLQRIAFAMWIRFSHYQAQAKLLVTGKPNCSVYS